MPIILAVEDDPWFLDALQELLQLEEIQVIRASNGQEGLDYARNAHPDLILLDILLPYLNGLVVGQRLADDPATRDIPILYLSGAHIDPESILQAPNACGFLRKPFKVDALLDAIHAALDCRESGEHNVDIETKD